MLKAFFAAWLDAMFGLAVLLVMLACVGSAFLGLLTLLAGEYAVGAGMVAAGALVGTLMVAWGETHNGH